jgi:hypothetical protein
MLPPHTTVDMKNAAIAAVDTADGLDASTLPMVSYGFTTSQHNHALVARTLSTFAAGIPANLIVVATTDAASWKIDASRGLLPNVTVFKTNCREKPIDLGRGFDQACKSTMLLRRQFAVAPHAEWYARVADDCFFVPSHVQRALHMFNPARRIYGGCADYRFGDLSCNEHMAQSDIDAAVQCRNRRLFREVHAAGGSLFVLSRALMSWFDAIGAAHYLRGGYRKSYNDDVGMGAFMTIVANAPVTVLPGVFQAPRFDSKLLSTRRLDVDQLADCHCPLPPTARACLPPLPPNLCHTLLCLRAHDSFGRIALTYTASIAFKSHSRRLARWEVLPGVSVRALGVAGSYGHSCGSSAAASLCSAPRAQCRADAGASWKTVGVLQINHRR